MDAKKNTDLSFEGAALATRREMMKLTPGQRINRAVELAELGRNLRDAVVRAKAIREQARGSAGIVLPQH